MITRMTRVINIKIRVARAKKESLVTLFWFSHLNQVAFLLRIGIKIGHYGFQCGSMSILGCHPPPCKQVTSQG